MKTYDLQRRADHVHVEPVASDDAEFVRVKISFSSEHPVERIFGAEVLDHSPAAVDLSRLAGGAAPFLLEHDPSRQVGVIERAWLEGRRGVAIVRFSRGSDGAAVARDILDGIRQSVSVGYRVHAAEETEDGFRVTRWEPFELSSVSIPADPSVGFGRAGGRFTDPAVAYRAFSHSDDEVPIMETDTKTEGSRRQRAAEREALTAERTRVRRIGQLGRKYDLEDEAEAAIDNGDSIESFQKRVLAKLQEDTTDIGGAPSDSYRAPAIHTKRHGYSLSRAILCAARGQIDGIEGEAHRELERRTGKSSQGILVPLDAVQTRAVDYATEGADLVGTDRRPEQFIDLLRNASVVQRAGAMMIPAGAGNISIPRQSAASTAYWVDGDGTDVTESTPTYDAITMEPHTVGALASFTHRMLRQSLPAVDQLVARDLAQVLAVEMDRAALNGNGTGAQPSGILDTSGVSTDTYSAAPDYADIVSAIATLAGDNVPTSAVHWVAAPALGFGMANTALDAGSGRFLLDLSQFQEQGAAGGVLGRPLWTTANMPAGTLLGGDFRDLLVATWGVLEILSDPFGANFASGSVSVRALLDVDFGVRHPESFIALTAA